jgi:hypothetical protein
MDIMVPMIMKNPMVTRALKAMTLGSLMALKLRIETKIERLMSYIK